MRFLCFIFALVTLETKADTIRHLDNSLSFDHHSTYFVKLLQLALEKSHKEYGDYTLRPVSTRMHQERQLLSLENNMLDIMWTVTSNEREAKARPIRIPLLKGLIGHRVFVIRKDRQRDFSTASDLSGLSDFTAVQGHDWPDAHILENAGLSVARRVWSIHFYKLLEDGNADYYPRSVLEILGEMRDYATQTLTVEQRHLLVYPSAMYFFVNQDNGRLAERIESGLRAAIADGSFDSLFYAHPTHIDAIKTLNLGERTLHSLTNPLLPEKTPVNDKSLWFNPHTLAIE